MDIVLVGRRDSSKSGDGSCAEDAMPTPRTAAIAAPAASFMTVPRDIGCLLQTTRRPADGRCYSGWATGASTDVRVADQRGHQVVKLGAEDNRLMTIGERGAAGEPPRVDDAAGVAVTPGGEIGTIMLDANFAAGELGDYGAMRRHADHVLQLLERPEGTSGPGRGFGVIPAVEALVNHLERAAATTTSFSPSRPCRTRRLPPRRGEGKGEPGASAGVAPQLAGRGRDDRGRLGRLGPIGASARARADRGARHLRERRDVPHRGDERPRLAAHAGGAVLGLGLSGRLDPPDRDERLARMEPTFAEWVHLYFDGERAPTSATYLPPADDGPVAPDGTQLGVMRLDGRVPPGAETFSFAYGLIMDAYPLLIRDRSDEVVTYWNVGEYETEPMLLGELTPPTRCRWWAPTSDWGSPTSSQGARSHPVRGRHLPPRHAPDPDAGPGDHLHRRPHHHLGLSMVGVLSLPARVVEPLIALSIAYVAVENIVTSELKPWRLALVFGFGLLHGLGFAGVLAELGLPRGEFAAALMSFNLGVEGGQLAVIAGLFAALGWARHAPWYRRAAWSRCRWASPPSACTGPSPGPSAAAEARPRPRAARGRRFGFDDSPSCRYRGAEKPKGEHSCARCESGRPVTRTRGFAGYRGVAAS